MRDGYYISAYLSINSLANLYDISLRHDQTVALWLKQGNRIELVKYWELERKTGLKKHAKSLFSTKQCIELIENLLLEVKLKMNDIVEIWGTPGIGENISSYDSKLEYPYHSLCHLFSGLLVDSNVFFHENILAFALDGGPDNVVDIKSRNKEFYWGAFSHKGEVEYFNIPSPGAFWSIIKIRYGLEEGSLMALGSATTAYYRNINDVIDKYPYIYNADDFTIAYDWISRLCEYIETIDINNIEKYDHRFSEKDNRISVVVKIVQEISKDMI